MTDWTVYPLESLTMGESIDTLVDHGRSMQDAMVRRDSYVSVSNFVAAFTDTLGVIDTVDSPSGYGQELLDVLNSVDTAEAIQDHARNLSEVRSVHELVSRAQGYSRNLLDRARLRERINRLNAMQQYFQEMRRVTDGFVQTPGQAKVEAMAVSEDVLVTLTRGTVDIDLSFEEAAEITIAYEPED